MRARYRWLAAPFLGTAVAAVALWRGALAPSGAAGASVVGTAIFGASGPLGSALLLLFFGGSSALSRLAPGDKPAEETAPRRTLAQVLANGGLPALLALANAARPSPRLAAAYAGALAAANADTWATEIGALSTAPPRMITTGQRARPGDSGAVTPLGTLGSAAGALLLGVAGAAIERRQGLALPLAAAGFAGSLADSLLGATVQVVYRCDECGERTEDRAHAHDDTPPRLTVMRGLPFMTNDAVNVCTSLVGALGGAVVADTYKQELAFASAWQRAVLEPVLRALAAVGRRRGFEGR